MAGGIYIIVVEDKIIYVGKTKRSFEQRFKEHKRAVEGKAQAYKIHRLIREYKEQGIQPHLLGIYQATDEEDLNELEQQYIDLFQPIGNVQSNKRKDAKV